MSPGPAAGAEVVRHRLRPPPSPGVYLPRPSLQRRVLELPAAGTCLLTAPAGYGSTVLLAAVAGQAGRGVVWVSCPAGDRHRVWAQVLDALAGAGVDTSAATARLGDADPVGFRHAVLNALAEAPAPLLLVLDDLDGLAHAGALADLAAIADALPPTTRLVLRVEHGDLGPRRAASSGRFTRLGVRDLRLTDDEAWRLVRELAPDLPRDRAAEVVDLAEGWVAALVAPFVPGARDPAHDPAAWLVDEGAAALGSVLLDPLPPADRQLLVRCSVVDAATPALAAVLARCAEEEAADAIDRLGRWGLLHPVLDQPGAVALHRLVAVQARRLLASRGPDELRRTRRAAARWLQQQGRVAEAIDQALDAGDVRWALGLLEGMVGTLMDTGQAAQVVQWYGRAPEPFVAEDHLHLLAACWAELMAGDVLAARERLDRLIEVVDLLPAPATRAPAPGHPPPASQQPESAAEWLRGEVLLLRSYFAWWRGRPRLCTAFAEQATASFGGRWVRTSHQASAIQALRSDAWFGDPAAAHTALLAVAARPSTREPIRRGLLGLQAVLAVRQGHVRRGGALAHEAIEVARRYGSPIPFENGEARLALACSRVDLGEHGEALEEARTVAEAVGRSGHVTYLLLARVVQGQALAGLGRYDQALEVFGLARGAIRAAGAEADLHHHLDAAEARARLEAGDRAGASALVRRLPVSPDTEVLALRLSTPSPEELRRRLRSVRANEVRRSVDLGLLLAASLAPSRPTQAREHLLRAASTAHDVGLLTALRGAPDALRVLAVSTSTHPGAEAVATLLRHAAASQAPADAVGESLVLSEHEHRLLQVLLAHHGHRAQAEALGVSVNTVKTRLRRLYRKLGVSSRQEALATARAAGLLPPASPGIVPPE